jgi:hypothetical protein
MLDYRLISRQTLITIYSNVELVTMLDYQTLITIYSNVELVQGKS